MVKMIDELLKFIPEDNRNQPEGEESANESTFFKITYIHRSEATRPNDETAGADGRRASSDASSRKRRLSE